MATSLIKEDQTVLLFAVVLAIVAISITLEQRYHWASVLSSCILSIFGGFVAANIGLIPHSAPAFSAIGNVILICSIPLLLFKANVKQIVKDSGKLFIMFHICAVGTVLGCFVAYLIFGKIENVKYLLTIVGAGSVGGTVNCIAMGSVFEIPENTLASYVVVGNFCVGLLILFLRLIGNSKKIRAAYPHPHMDAFEQSVDQNDLAKSGKTLSGLFWGGKEVGLKDIAQALAVTFVIVGIGQVIASWVVSLNPPDLIKQLFGSVYMTMTLITVACATVFHKFMSGIRGTMELGNVGLLMWFCTIGISGNIVEIIRDGLLCIALFFCVAFINLGLGLLGAKLIKANWEDVACANMATVGGPPTVASMAVSFGWDRLVIPGILVGLWGYAIGNYFGIAVGNVLSVPINSGLV